MIGECMHQFARQLWPLNRSLTGEGVRRTLTLVRDRFPALQLRRIPSGTPVFDWKVPKEWRVREAWIRTPDGRRICDFAENNLHLVGYSVPFRGTLSLRDLQPHLHSLDKQPDAVPYVTSYYQERWGFCLPDTLRRSLPEGLYEVVVDTELFNGHLDFGEGLIPGESEEEVLLSTYVCHPSMANNEISGIVVTTFLAEWLMRLPRRKFSYRFVFLPETIGSLSFLSERIEHLKRRVAAGFVVTCVGDERGRSFLPSRRGDTLSDRIGRHVLKWLDPNFRAYSWSDRGSDERQYCAPYVDLPIATICRSLYGRYPEYHTSHDDLERVVTPAGLEGGYEALRRALEVIEHNDYPVVTVIGEPQLGRRGLYPTLSTKEGMPGVRLMMDLISWSDGKHDILEIAELCGVPVWELYPIVDQLKALDLIRLESHPDDGP